MPTFIEWLLDEEDEGKRRRAVHILEDIGPAAAPAVEVLLELLDEPDSGPGAATAEEARSQMPSDEDLLRSSIVDTLIAICRPAAPP